MQYISLFVDTLFFAAVAFVSLVLLNSHLRYRRMVLSARARAGGEGVEPEDVEILAVDAGFKTPLPSLCLSAESPLHPHRENLARQLRRKDKIIPLRDGRLVLLLRTEEAQFAAVARRVLPLIIQTSGLPVKAYPLHDFSDLLRNPAELPPLLPPPTPDFSPMPGQEHLLDPLTGVLHPSRVSHAFRKLLAAERLHNRPLCILRVDVDGMAEINQHLGRETGDALLTGVAQRLMLHCRANDLIGRLGDDEFLICLPGLPTEILDAARRMATAIRAEPFVIAGSEIRCTVCIGLAGAPAHGQSPGALYEASGLALAAACARGRGVWLSWDPALRPRPVLPQTRTDDNGPEAF